jgi:hypothetical protein
VGRARSTTNPARRGSPQKEEIDKWQTLSNVKASGEMSLTLHFVFRTKGNPVPSERQYSLCAARAARRFNHDNQRRILMPRTVASEVGDALCKLYLTEFRIIDPSHLPTKFLDKIFESLPPEIRTAATYRGIIAEVEAALTEYRPIRDALEVAVPVSLSLIQLPFTCAFHRDGKTLYIRWAHANLEQIDSLPRDGGVERLVALVRPRMALWAGRTLGRALRELG